MYSPSFALPRPPFLVSKIGKPASLKSFLSRFSLLSFLVFCIGVNLFWNLRQPRIFRNPTLHTITNVLMIKCNGVSQQFRARLWTSSMNLSENSTSFKSSMTLFQSIVQNGHLAQSLLSAKAFMTLPSIADKNDLYLTLTFRNVAGRYVSKFSFSFFRRPNSVCRFCLDSLAYQVPIWI